MNHRPRLSALDLWGQHEALCLRLLRQALSDLASKATLEQDEDTLNRELYKAIIRCSQSVAEPGEHLPVVVPEGRNPPVSSDRERAEREFKIPDFYWAYIDQYANDSDDAAKQFVVECKRLTTPSADYARKYVKSGIARFMNVGHGYGKGVGSGAMVGYLQHMVLDDAIHRINGIAEAEGIPPLNLGWRANETRAEFHHDVTRPFPMSPFRLAHIWWRMGAGSSI